MNRLEQTIYNLKATRRFAPTKEILAGRTMDEYYKDEAIFMIQFKDALEEQTNKELAAQLTNKK